MRKIIMGVIIGLIIGVGLTYASGDIDADLQLTFANSAPSLEQQQAMAQVAIACYLRDIRDELRKK
ncbi:MAG: hypothetical protein NTY76_08180 [Candidatus Omnitrophica bacterium]|nr:hypothetical protein [Candidatus Omnitrophota bacterium]